MVPSDYFMLIPKMLLLHQLYLAKKTRAEKKFIKEEKCRNAVAFQVKLETLNKIVILDIVIVKI